MTGSYATRRSFLIDSSHATAAGWLSLGLPWLTALAGCARDDANARRPFERLTPGEARTLAAFADQIIPADDGVPGAGELGAAHFIDRALGTPFFADSSAVVRAGLRDLDVRAHRAAQRDFASLPAERQVELMREIEHDAFFGVTRSLVVMGVFADPAHGANRDGLGWKLIGIEHHGVYAPPYGWYDAQPAATTESAP